MSINTLYLEAMEKRVPLPLPTPPPPAIVRKSSYHYHMREVCYILVHVIFVIGASFGIVALTAKIWPDANYKKLTHTSYNITEVTGGTMS